MALLRSVISLAQYVALCLSADDADRTGRGFSYDSCRRLIINNSYRRNKPVTGFGDGLDISVVARLLIESLAKRRHIPVEVAFLDITVRPDVSDQVLFGHDFAGTLQQDQKNSEDCRR